MRKNTLSILTTILMKKERRYILGKAKILLHFSLPTINQTNMKLFTTKVVVMKKPWLWWKVSFFTNSGSTEIRKNGKDSYFRKIRRSNFFRCSKEICRIFRKIIFVYKNYFSTKISGNKISDFF